MTLRPNWSATPVLIPSSTLPQRRDGVSKTSSPFEESYPLTHSFRGPWMSAGIGTILSTREPQTSSRAGERRTPSHAGERGTPRAGERIPSRVSERGTLSRVGGTQTPSRAREKQTRREGRGGSLLVQEKEGLLARATQKATRLPAGRRDPL